MVASVGCDAAGHAYNINADTAAASIAAKLHAENMILVSDIPGLLRNPEDEGSLIPRATLSEIEELKKDGVISGGKMCIRDSLHYHPVAEGKLQ